MRLLPRAVLKMGLAHKNFKVKNLYSEFFHDKSIPRKTPCKTVASRFDRNFSDYKKGLLQEEIFLRQSLFFVFDKIWTAWKKRKPSGGFFMKGIEKAVEFG